MTRHVGERANGRQWAPLKSDLLPNVKRAHHHRRESGNWLDSVVGSWVYTMQRGHGESAKTSTARSGCCIARGRRVVRAEGDLSALLASLHRDLVGSGAAVPRHGSVSGASDRHLPGGRRRVTVLSGGNPSRLGAVLGRHRRSNGNHRREILARINIDDLRRHGLVNRGVNLECTTDSQCLSGLRSRHTHLKGI